MTSSPKPSDSPILNPRYKGATPEDVARALLRKWGRPSKDNEPDPETETEAA